VNYSHLRLQDQGEVLIVYFQGGTLTDQTMIDQIGKELGDVALEASGNRKLLVNCTHNTVLRLLPLPPGLDLTTPLLHEVYIAVRWQGRAGPRQIELRTLLPQAVPKAGDKLP